MMEVYQLIEKYYNHKIPLDTLRENLLDPEKINPEDVADVLIDLRDRGMIDKNFVLSYSDQYGVNE